MPENVGDAEVSVSGDLSSFQRFLQQLKKGLESLEKGDVDVAIEAVDKASDEIRDIKDKVEDLDAEEASVDLDAEDQASGDIKKVGRKVDELDSEKATVGLAAKDKATSDIKKVDKKVNKLDGEKATVKLKAKDEATPAIQSLMGSLKKFAAGGAAAAAVYMVTKKIAQGVKAISKAMIGGAADMESYRNTLTTVMGSAEEAGKMMNWVVNFAKSTPFEIPGLTEAAVRLQAYGIDARDVMGTLGDTASAMGKDVMEAVEALADAQTGEFERLKEFGVKALEVREEHLAQFGLSADALGQTMLTYTDKNGKEAVKVVDRNNREMITSNLMAIWNERYAGAMEKQSTSWKGIVSNIKDTVTVGFTKVGEAILPKVKEIASGVLDMLSSDKFTSFFTSLGNAALSIVPVVAQVVDSFMEFAVTSGLLEGLVEILGSLGESVGIIFAGLLDAITPLIPPIVNIGKLFAEMVELVAPLIGELVGMFADILQPVLEAVFGVFESLMPAFEGLVVIQQALYDALQPVIDAFGFLVELLGTGLAAAIDFVTKPLQWIGDALGTAAAKSDEAKQAFLEFKQTIADSAKDTHTLWNEYQNLQEKLGSLDPKSQEFADTQQRLQQITDELIEQQPRLFGGFDENGNQVLKNSEYCDDYIQKMLTVGEAGDKAAESQGGLVQQMRDWQAAAHEAQMNITNWDAAMDNVENTLKDFGVTGNDAVKIVSLLAKEGMGATDQLVELAKGAGLSDEEAEQLTETLLTLADKIPGLNEGLEGNKEQLLLSQEEFRKLSDEIKATAQTAGKEGWRIPQEIIEALEDGNPEIQRLGQEGMEAYVQEIVNARVPSQEQAAALTSDVNTKLGQLRAGEISVEEFQSFLNGIAEKHPEIAGLVAQIASEMGVTLSSPDTYGVGSNLMAGLHAGIDAYYINTLRARVGQIAQDIASTLRNAFDISSPSKVFFRIGQNLMEGLALGMEFGQDLVRGATAELADIVNITPVANVSGSDAVANTGTTQVVHYEHTGDYVFPNVRTGEDARDVYDKVSADAAHLARNMP